MTPHAALGVLAAGIGLFCFTFRALRPLARIIGFALVVLGLAVMTQDLLGFNLGIDQALVRADVLWPMRRPADNLCICRLASPAR
jgi:hypothetical protein